MAATRVSDDYNDAVMAAASSVLCELWTTLGAYRDAMVLVGGGAPYYLLEVHTHPENDFRHVGTIDIDVALDASKIDEDAYASIVDLLLKRGYTPKDDKLGRKVPASLMRVIVVDGREFKVQVDFMTSHDGGKHRHKKVQPELHARMTRGCELAFAHNFVHAIKGALPGNGEGTVDVRVADVPAILTMKGIALGERYKEKDAYDIWAVLAHYADGPADAARQMKAVPDNDATRDAIDKMRRAFESERSNGPAWVAEFVGGNDAERARVRTDAYMVVTEFLKILDQGAAGA